MSPSVSSAAGSVQHPGGDDKSLEGAGDLSGTKIVGAILGAGRKGTPQNAHCVSLPTSDSRRNTVGTVLETNVVAAERSLETTMGVFDLTALRERAPEGRVFAPALLVPLMLGADLRYVVRLSRRLLWARTTCT